MEPLDKDILWLFSFGSTTEDISQKLGITGNHLHQRIVELKKRTRTRSLARLLYKFGKGELDDT